MPIPDRSRKAALNEAGRKMIKLNLHSIWNEHVVVFRSKTARTVQCSATYFCETPSSDGLCHLSSLRTEPGNLRISTSGLATAPPSSDPGQQKMFVLRKCKLIQMNIYPPCWSLNWAIALEMVRKTNFWFNVGLLKLLYFLGRVRPMSTTIELHSSFNCWSCMHYIAAYTWEILITTECWQVIPYWNSGRQREAEKLV